ncbi:2-hydroxyacyl-CoA lyase [Galdieria sulphuraria]|nr:2-hydroxyacyl-CoA lyase [Galdieria sulphuraria]
MNDVLRNIPNTSSPVANNVAVGIAGTDNILSYSQLRDSVARVCEEITKVTQKGDVISLILPNSVEFVVSFLAVTWAGAIAAPLNEAYRKDEFLFYLQDAGAKAIIVIQDQASKEALDAAESLKLPIWSLSKFIANSRDISIQIPSSQWNGAQSTTGSSRALPDDVALFLHTSGTTSKPKGVPLTHKNLMTSIRNISKTYELSDSDVTLLVMPLFHVHGLMAALLSTLATGGQVWIPGEGRFSASNFWKHCVQHKVTWYTAVPTIHQILVSRAEQDYPKSNPPPLRFIRSCSSSLAPNILDKMEKLFNAPVLEAYAMTEASHQMTSNPLPKNGKRKPGSVGKGQNVEVAILSDNCEILGPNKVGEVCIRGENVTKGYLNNPKANEEAFAGGWFHTGDQGYLDEDGYLTLTGRIKELINRGGEKISPLEVDAALLSHPNVSEAVSFGVSDEKYGEEVEAAVILKDKSRGTTEKDITEDCKSRIASFKVPKKIYIVDDFPRTGSGKIQRRIVAQNILEQFGSQNDALRTSSKNTNQGNETKSDPSTTVDGYQLVAKILKCLGINAAFGVLGIPVTKLGICCQQEQIRFISTRHELPASYAAGAFGYLQRKPGVCVTVSGPGCLHALAGLASATVNCFPMILISGAAENSQVDRGAFQECDQLRAALPHAKQVFRVEDIGETARYLCRAYHVALSGRPGGVYIEFPSNVLHQRLQANNVEDLLSFSNDFISSPRNLPTPTPDVIDRTVQLLKKAERPLIVIGKGANYACAEQELSQFINNLNIPFLATPMGKGCVPDSHPLSASAARSLVLKEADVVFLVGARLNWILHYGKPPRWSDNCKFIQLDICEEEFHRNANITMPIFGDIQESLKLINEAVTREPFQVPKSWLNKVRQKCEENARKLELRLQEWRTPLDFHCALNAMRVVIMSLPNPKPILVSEGANTMDFGRLILPVEEPRSRLDAGTWGTMGVGMGYAIASSVSYPGRSVIALEGDSAFGFSGMEIETIIRYNLPIVTVVFNNNGIYGGTEKSADPYDPAPTSFVPNAHYEKIAEAFGGLAYWIETAEQLGKALRESLEAKKPALLNVVIDPSAGTESGSLTSHN